MVGVPETECANGSVGFYGKGQSILVKKIKKKTEVGEKKNRIALKGKAAKKLVKNSSKTAGRKKRGFTEFSATTTSREAKSNLRSTHKMKLTQKIRPCFIN